jgi:hypothetical protein
MISSPDNNGFFFLVVFLWALNLTFLGIFGLILSPLSNLLLMSERSPFFFIPITLSFLLEFSPKLLWRNEPIYESLDGRVSNTSL